MWLNAHLGCICCLLKVVYATSQPVLLVRRSAASWHVPFRLLKQTLDSFGQFVSQAWYHRRLVLLGHACKGLQSSLVCLSWAWQAWSHLELRLAAAPPEHVCASCLHLRAWFMLREPVDLPHSTSWLVCFTFLFSPQQVGNGATMTNI